MKYRILLFASALMSMIVFGSVATAQQPAPSKNLANFHQVKANLYRSGQPRDEGFAELARLGIKTVINLRDDDARAQAEAKLAAAAGLQYFNLPLSNIKHPSPATVEKVLALINDPQNQPVLVHCKRGADRTGTIIACNRIAHDGWTSDQALHEAKTYGLGWWQHWMKDFIEDYGKQHAAKAASRTYDPLTTFPEGFDPRVHGMAFEETNTEIA